MSLIPFARLAIGFVVLNGITWGCRSKTHVLQKISPIVHTVWQVDTTQAVSHFSTMIDLWRGKPALWILHAVDNCVDVYSAPEAGKPSHRYCLPDSLKIRFFWPVGQDSLLLYMHNYTGACLIRLLTPSGSELLCTQHRHSKIESWQDPLRDSVYYAYSDRKIPLLIVDSLAVFFLRRVNDFWVSRHHRTPILGSIHMGSRAYREYGVHYPSEYYQNPYPNTFRYPTLVDGHDGWVHMGFKHTPDLWSVQVHTGELLHKPMKGSANIASVPHLKDSAMVDAHTMALFKDGSYGVLMFDKSTGLYWRQSYSPFELDSKAQPIDPKFTLLCYDRQLNFLGEWLLDWPWTQSPISLSCVNGKLYAYNTTMTNATAEPKIIYTVYELPSP